MELPVGWEEREREGGHCVDVEAVFSYISTRLTRNERNQFGATSAALSCSPI